MAFDNYFTINLPYGMMKNKDGKWTCFNKGYEQLGDSISKFDHETDNYLYTKYKGITEKLLLELADRFETDSSGKINKLWFYNSTTNPSVSNQKQDWDNYFIKIKKLSKLKRSL